MGKVESKYEKWHRRNIRKYEKLIDEIYRKAVNETLSLSGTIDKLPEDKILSFKDYPLTNKLVEKILDKLRKRIETVVLNGIDAEWTLANDKNNELTKRVYANNLALMTYNASRQYYTNNEAARQAFIERKEKGLNLSQRVWNYSEQFKEELEMGLDVGIRNGESADEISRDIRQYLKYPDKLFRRVRDKHGQLQLSQKAKAFHPGQGVYRSSYKNARRLAATETNMAYRTSDYERWQTMDFVVGIQINLSNNHTCLGRDGKPHAFYDICDELAGKYPKTFKFTGWHPHCRCYVTTILKSHEEMRENNKRVMRGEEPLQGSKNEVKNIPPQFKKWVDDNQDRIARAKTLPYFLRDNGKMTDEGYILNMGT